MCPYRVLKVCEFKSVAVRLVPDFIPGSRLIIHGAFDFTKYLAGEDRLEVLRVVLLQVQEVADLPAMRFEYSPSVTPSNGCGCTIAGL